MAEEEKVELQQLKHENQDLPQVLVLGSPTCLQTLKQLYSHKFRFLIPNTSLDSLYPLTAPLSSISAVICSASFSITAPVLRLLPSLRLVVTTSAGTDHIDLNECGCRGIQVAGAGKLFSDEVADMAVGLLIDVMRRVSAADRFVRTICEAATWDFPLGYKISGKRIGIVGLGSIGMEVAKRLECFGCTILYHSKHKKSAVSYPFYNSVIDLAATSNALVLCCALNEETRHIVNREVMLALGKEGFIVNVGRGSLIDEKQLVKFLMDGEIGGAALDVFEDEPNVPKELLSMDNVVLTPHCAAFTSECIIKLCELVAGNIEASLSDKPLITQVKW
ncbi:hypothetical protein HN51_023167 [Arachis hypogaea]|uniref:glyoxylate/hydroxypyruvate reductase HPR3 n=1 Tax=Arachis hypogaea TaxID=3818 RepID=UPI000DEC17F4|nr:glyoxylate/hydroxypyruvate reductase HPR3 [Arachis hypogaea]QHO54576.1 Glyoxylate/hydroxypyruvate reductase [Arachis hypogaea]